MEVVAVGGASVHVLHVVRGLPSDRAKVSAAFDSVRPAVVGVSVAPEELEALARFRGKPLEPDNIEDEVYLAGLSAWEEPTMPPPCFLEAAALGRRTGVRLEALDLDEEAYADAYTECVSAMELILQGRLENRLSRKRFQVATPEEFVLAWDAEVNRPAGFTGLQRRRERHMAERLREAAASGGPVLAVIEVERARGVVSALRA